MSRSSFGWNFSTFARMSSKRIMVRILDDRGEAFQLHSSSKVRTRVAADSLQGIVLPTSPSFNLRCLWQQKSLLRLHLKRLANKLELWVGRSTSSDQQYPWFLLWPRLPCGFAWLSRSFRRLSSDNLGSPRTGFLHAFSPADPMTSDRAQPWQIDP